MTSPTIMHIDMDAFFASVEQLDNPALRGKCVAVGGSSKRGVLAAVSYEARRFGIHSAMPVFQARQKCTELIIVAPRRKRYQQLSQIVMSILRDISPLVEPVSIDEAYVDISGCQRLHGTVRDIALMAKNRIFNQTQLTCSAGVAPNKFLAKIASDMQKPNGLTIITPDQVMDFIGILPISKVPGVGTRAQQVLATIGIKTLGQVRGCPQDLLLRKLGQFGQRLVELSHGHDDSTVIPHSVPKSISTETTLPCNTRDRALLKAQLLEQSQSVARRLRHQQVRAGTITLKIKTVDFKRHTRSQKLSRSTQSSKSIFEASVQLLNAFALNQAVRLVGVGASNLQSSATPMQGELFPAAQERQNRKWEQIDRAVDQVTERFGRKAIVRAALAGSKDGRK